MLAVRERAEVDGDAAGAEVARGAGRLVAGDLGGGDVLDLGGSQSRSEWPLPRGTKDQFVDGSDATVTAPGFSPVPYREALAAKLAASTV